MPSAWKIAATLLFVAFIFIAIPFLIAAAIIWFVFVYLGVTIVQFIAIAVILITMSMVYELFKQDK